MKTVGWHVVISAVQCTVYIQCNIQCISCMAPGGVQATSADINYAGSKAELILGDKISLVCYCCH
jgi:hypothetical protein